MTFHSERGSRDLTLTIDQEEQYAEPIVNKVPGVDSYTANETALISAWLVNVDTLRDEDPQTLQQIINIAGATEDVSQVSLPYLAGKFIEALDINEQEVIDSVDSAPLLMNVTKGEWYDSLDAKISSYADAMQPTRSVCDCEEFYADMINIPIEEFNNCMTQCVNYVPGQEEQDDDTGGFSNTLVGGIVNDLWDATLDNFGTILNAFLGGGNNNSGSTSSGNTGGNGGDEDDEETENKVDWGKIAIWGGVVIAIGIGAYFVFRRKR